MTAWPKGGAAPAPPPASVPLGAGDGLALFTIVCFASSYAGAKPVLAVMDPTLFATLRMLLAGFALLVACRFAGGRMLPARGTWAALFGLGLLGVTFFQAAWAAALQLTPASQGAVLIATSPIFGALFGRLRGERAGWVGWLGVLLAFAGVALVVSRGDPGALGGDSLVGALLWLFAAAAWALYTALSLPLVATLGPLRTMAWTLTIGGVALLPVGLPRAMVQDWAPMTPVLWGQFAYLSLVVSGLAMVCWYAGLARLGVTRVMVYIYLIPVVAVAIAWALLGERFTAVQVVGALAVLAGIHLTRRGARTARPADQAASHSQ